MDQTRSPYKILVIDDEESYREIISITLGVQGYEVIEAMNGLDGLAAAKMQHPDLILCDVNMPKMDGHELLSTLRSEQEFAGIPFIFLTGNSATSDRRKGMLLGADDFLTKPFTSVELVEAVETRLAKKTTLQKFYEDQFDDIKSNIMHSLPHEFRTPLNGILGFSQLLMDEENLPPDEIKNVGKMIHRSGRRLHHLLENLVLFGQLQLWIHDEQKIKELRNNSSSLIEVVRMCAEKQMAKHERIGAIEVAVENAFVQISAIRLTKIIEEIIDNALKFSVPGTTITISSTISASEVQIVIRDAGRGMSDEQLKKIAAFQQFERNYYEQQGAGLGLVIVKSLTEIHGGRISIESQEHNGTAVTITLPKLVQ